MADGGWDPRYTYSEAHMTCFSMVMRSAISLVSFPKFKVRDGWSCEQCDHSALHPSHDRSFMADSLRADPKFLVCTGHLSAQRRP